MMKNAGSDDDCDDLSRNKSFMEALCVAIAEKLSSADRTAMSALLSLLSTAAGTTLLFLGSNWNCWTTTITQMSFDAWPLPRRTRALAQWQRSSLVLHRQAFSGLKRLIGALAFSFVPNEEEATAAVVAANHSTTTNTNNTNISTKNNTNYNNTGSSSKTNPFWEGMGFPGSPTTWQALDPDQVAAADRRQAPLVQALRSSRQELLDHHHQQQQQDQHPQSENTNTNPKNTNNTTGGDWDCDVILVGSGAGASVAALVLARAGWKVWILEKSVYKLPSTISLVESTALDEQYEQHGLLTTSNNGGVVSILAGSAVGGGTAINWSCCLPLPKYVRHEWARVYGLEAFRVKHDTPPLEPSSSSSAKSSKSATANDADATAGAKDKYELDNNNSDEYDTSLAFILNILGATEKDKRKIVHNAMNRKLQEGCDALGYPWEVTGQVSAMHTQ